MIESHFPVLLKFANRGFWYFFLATIAFGEEPWAVFIAILLMSNGMLNSYVGCSSNTGNKDTNEEGEKSDKKALNEEEKQKLNKEEIAEDAVNVELGQIDINDDEQGNEETPLTEKIKIIDGDFDSEQHEA
eukprot:CAMPEP_0201577956 /NCGR_PEP_ID=MMETSP0190_2-20130828/24566_1 /ASSEMBLY_ACC=CAM_ASM_000263 /TAXON_ID=37353 /ORGANISM="Rosalina sp." /LENGTH=130 /DNA_ID=CAMNT_0048010565 /DNA_START=330 /DNA_END=722 /DNA_ORIENTATION=-